MALFLSFLAVVRKYPFGLVFWRSRLIQPYNCLSLNQYQIIFILLFIQIYEVVKWKKEFANFMKVCNSTPFSIIGIAIVATLFL